MSYMESYEFLDWPLLSGQLPTGLSVQLPGSESLLPSQNGYLVEPAFIVLKEFKNHAKDNNLILDFGAEDDWNSLDAAANHSPGDFFSSDLFDADELLPASPEIVTYDLNAGSECLANSHATLSINKKPEVFCKVQLENSESSVSSPVSVPGAEQLAVSVPKDIFESGHLCDFDPDWLLSSVPILPSLEDVESVLSASPQSDVISGLDEQLSLEEYETNQNKSICDFMPSTFADAQLDGLPFSESPVNILIQASPALENSVPIEGSSVQVPQNIAWFGDGINWSQLALFTELTSAENKSVVVPRPEHESVANLNLVRSPGTEEKSVFSLTDKVVQPNPNSVRIEPYPTSGVKPERRERKREQNKTAALKYRQKKRSEQGVCLSECEQLEKRNVELKSRAEELTREISYLKGLISEIYSSQAE